MLNQVQIIGHVGRDPEIRYLTSGDAVVTLSIATTEAWRDKQTGERKEATEWHKINFFGKLAEIVGEYSHKGTQMFVQGKLRTRKYKDKDGIEKYSTEIIADTMKLLGGKSNTSQPRASNGSQEKPETGFKDMDDDIPF